MKINELLKIAKDRGASDIHIASGAPPMIRVHGRLQPLEQADALTVDQARYLIYSMMFEEQRRSYEQAPDFDMAYSDPEHGRFRVNVFKDNRGICATLRAIPTDIPNPEDIGIPEAVLNLCVHRNGLVLVTGPTGSGKSTTLASMINKINKEKEAHIVTVEDPIEFVYSNVKSLVNQREVGMHTASFPRAIKSLLRQDLNVALIGELRDLETIEAALTIAETGHLVFGTLHTIDASQTIDRVVDVFPPHSQQQIRAMLGGTLRGVVCQQLIPRRDGMGRLAAREILIVTPGIANQIREGKTHQIFSAIQTGQQLGMVTMQDSVLGLLKQGLVSQETAMAAGVPPEAIRAFKESEGGSSTIEQPEKRPIGSTAKESPFKKR